MWELWIEGFILATLLRPESWQAIAESGDENAAAALSGILVLIDIARDESDLSRQLIDGLTDEAPNLIPTWVALLHNWRVARSAPVPTQAGRPIKTGRNEPCTCGSGKKYKKCCGLN